MITLRTEPGQKLAELGGGNAPLVHPNIDIRQCYDAEGKPTVDIVIDLNITPWPLQSEEWDGIISKFCIEHMSWRCVRPFVSEVFRILKPGGKAVIITANTEAQLEWIRTKGFSNKPETSKGGDFEDCSCILFGDQDYPENTHRNYLSPDIATELLVKVGFENVTIRPYGDIETDMLVEATKPLSPVDQTRQETFTKLVEPGAILDIPRESKLSEEERVTYFNREYFNGKVYQPFYWDYPAHVPTANFIKARAPKSVLELGGGRGYVTKKLQDMGIVACGMDISRHAWLTRVCQGVLQWDVCKTPWIYKDKEFTLCFSTDFLDRVPEEHLPKVVREMSRVSQRCVHGIDLTAKPGGSDKGRCTIRPKEWWVDLFYKESVKDRELFDYEIVHKDVMERMIDFPQEVLKGDGKLKLNIGCAMTQFHGWVNIDVFDHLAQFAQGNGFNYLKHDVTSGLPYSTGSVDLITMSHVLEHFTYREGLALLRDCRRVLKTDGTSLLRISVPDAFILMDGYCAIDNNLWKPEDDALFNDLAEINEVASTLPTKLSRVWSVLGDNHKAFYDDATLKDLASNSGFSIQRKEFRECASTQILRETTESLSSISAFYDLTPLVG